MRNVQLAQLLRLRCPIRGIFCVWNICIAEAQTSVQLPQVSVYPAWYSSPGTMRWYLIVISYLLFA